MVGIRYALIALRDDFTRRHRRAAPQPPADLDLDDLLS